MYKASRQYRFPWRSGQYFRLLVDSEQFFTAMLDSIAGARRYVCLEMYLFESGETASRFIEQLISAANRGVDIYLLLDDYGSRGLHKADRARLEHENISLVFYNPLRWKYWQRNLRRDHRKLLLVDGEHAYTGGAGIVDEFDQQQNARQYWHDVMLYVRGSCVADWLVLFGDIWCRYQQGNRVPDKATVQPDSGSDQLGRVCESRSTTNSEVMRSLLKQIRAAQTRIHLASAYFVPSRKIRRELSRAAARGVEVRLLLAGPCSDHPWVRHMARRYYDKLLNHGVRIFEYQPRFMHMKVILCDDWVSIGSSNLDRWNFRWNLEANQEIFDAGFCLSVMQLFEQDYLDSDQITLQDWQQRSYRVRLKVWWWSQVARVLSWFSFNR